MRIIKLPSLSRSQAINDSSINSTGEYLAVAETHIHIFKIKTLEKEIQEYEEKAEQAQAQELDRIRVEKEKDNEEKFSNMVILENGYTGNNPATKDKELLEITNSLNTTLPKEDKNKTDENTKNPKDHNSNSINSNENENEDVEDDNEEARIQTEFQIIKEKELLKAKLNKNVLLILDEDKNTSASTASFFNTLPNLIVSGGSGKAVIIHSIDYQKPSYLVIKNIPLGSEICEVRLTKTDSFILSSCFDNVVYIIHCEVVRNVNNNTFDNYTTNNNSRLDVKFTLCFKCDANVSIVQSIVVDPLGSNRFATYSENKRIMLFDIVKDTKTQSINNRLPSVLVKKLDSITDFETEEYNKPPMKKISWGNNDLLVSVNHKKICSNKNTFYISHCRIFEINNTRSGYNNSSNINLKEDSFSNSNILKQISLLVGHEAAIIVASFSTHLYKYKLPKKSNSKNNSNYLNNTTTKIKTGCNTKLNTAVKQSNALTTQTKQKNQINNTKINEDTINTMITKTAENDDFFSILVTGDVNGKLIIWEIGTYINDDIKSYNANIIFEINNLTDASVSSITWSKDGLKLYVCNISGNIEIIEFSEFEVFENSSVYKPREINDSFRGNNHNENVYNNYRNNNNNSNAGNYNNDNITTNSVVVDVNDGKKKKIVPTVIRQGLPNAFGNNGDDYNNPIDNNQNININANRNNQNVSLINDFYNNNNNNNNINNNNLLCRNQSYINNNQRPLMSNLNDNLSQANNYHQYNNDQFLNNNTIYNNNHSNNNNNRLLLGRKLRVSKIDYKKGFDVFMKLQENFNDMLLNKFMKSSTNNNSTIAANAIDTTNKNKSTVFVNDTLSIIQETTHFYNNKTDKEVNNNYINLTNNEDNKKDRLQENKQDIKEENKQDNQILTNTQLEKELNQDNSNNNSINSSITFTDYFPTTLSLIMNLQNNATNNTSIITATLNGKSLYIIKNNNKIIDFSFNNVMFSYLTSDKILTVRTLLNTIIFSQIKVKTLRAMKCFKNFFLLIKDNCELVVYNIYNKKEYLKLNMSFDIDTENDKITDVEFFGLDRIFIQVTSISEVDVKNDDDEIIMEKNNDKCGSYGDESLLDKKINKRWFVYNKDLNQFININTCLFNDEISKTIASLKNSYLNCFGVNNDNDKDYKDNNEKDSNLIIISNIENPYKIILNKSEQIDSLLNNNTNTNLNTNKSSPSKHLISSNSNKGIFKTSKVDSNNKQQIKSNQTICNNKNSNKNETHAIIETESYKNNNIEITSKLAALQNKLEIYKVLSLKDSLYEVVVEIISLLRDNNDKYSKLLLLDFLVYHNFLSDKNHLSINKDSKDKIDKLVDEVIDVFQYNSHTSSTKTNKIKFTSTNNKDSKIINIYLSIINEFSNVKK